MVQNLRCCINTGQGKKVEFAALTFPQVNIEQQYYRCKCKSNQLIDIDIPEILPN